MPLLRKLAHSILFKIILGFVALAFIVTGFSDFLLNGSGSWIAKIDGKKISYQTFTKALNNRREAILQSNNSEEAMKYLNSNQFRSDVLGKMINDVMVENLSKDLGLYASRELILQEIAKSPSFKNQEGKFDHNLFKKFLAKNDVDEAKYIQLVQSEIAAAMALQSMAVVAPTDNDSIGKIEEFKNEKRLANVLTLSTENVGKVAAPSDQILQEFYAKNKGNYVSPEFRSLSVVSFSNQDFLKDLQVSDKEVAETYAKNSEQFQTPESRDFYHILFDKEEAAKEFFDKLSAEKSKSEEGFLALVKTTQNKDKKAVTLTNVKKRDLLPALADSAFKLTVNQHSEPLQSPLGFHIFFLTNIKSGEAIPLAKVKNEIKQELLQNKKENLLSQKISEIDDSLLATNSTAETAKKFGLKIISHLPKINKNGQSEAGVVPNEIKDLDGLTQNAFALKQNETSKVLYSKRTDRYYAIKVEAIEASRQKEFAEVKSLLIGDWSTSEKVLKLQEFAKTVAEEVAKNPSDIEKVARRLKAKFEKNHEFPRTYSINIQGRLIPFGNKFLDELFTLKVGQSTSAVMISEKEFKIGVLNSVKKEAVSGLQLDRAIRADSGSFRNEIVGEYNKALVKKYPVEVNEKLLKVEVQKGEQE